MTLLSLGLLLHELLSGEQAYPAEDSADVAAMQQECGLLRCGYGAPDTPMEVEGGIPRS